ncbi:MAG TPA: hypothetical protein VLK25_04705 [Allosphingosinicella sp.]|nr:hypothetical protein [Allosphingosinicella sp.]
MTDFRKRRIGHRLFIALFFLSSCAPSGCDNNGPGAGDAWRNYPSLSHTPRSYPWLVLKCRVRDDKSVPAGLDTTIRQFFGLAGAGYGNLFDYFSDISYGQAGVYGLTFTEWADAPFTRADIATGSLAPPNQRYERARQCLDAIPAEQLPDLDSFYGVVVVTNVPVDGGACGTGPTPFQVRGARHNLACVWLNPTGLITAFAGHEFGHGLGLDDSFEDSSRNCGGEPGRYCDPWDIMSALRAYRFVSRNWAHPTIPDVAGPGMSAPALLRLGWLPPARIARFNQGQSGEQTFTLTALSRPAGTGFLVVSISPEGSALPESYTVEYRQAEGWDRGFTGPRAPAAVRESGGVVLVHRYRPHASPSSILVNGGALQSCQSMVMRGQEGNIHIWVRAIDTARGTATVSIGSGREAFRFCDRISGAQLPSIHVDRPFVAPAPADRIREQQKQVPVPPSP